MIKWFKIIVAEKQSICFSNKKCAAYRVYVHINCKAYIKSSSCHRNKWYQNQFRLICDKYTSEYYIKMTENSSESDSSLEEFYDAEGPR